MVFLKSIYKPKVISEISRDREEKWMAQRH